MFCRIRLDDQHLKIFLNLYFNKEFQYKKRQEILLWPNNLRIDIYLDKKTLNAK